MAVDDLLFRALQLPAVERGRMVRELIRSLHHGDVENAPEVERTWCVELERRVAEVDNDSAVRDLKEVCDELDARRRSNE